MRAHIGIGVDAELDLVCTARGPSVHVGDTAKVNALSRRVEFFSFGVVGYQGVYKRVDARTDVIRNIAIKPGKCLVLNKGNQADALIDQAEKLKASVRCKDQTAIWIYEGALPWLEEDQGAYLRAVCAIQLIDGGLKSDGSHGMCAPTNGASARQVVKRARTKVRNNGIGRI